MNIFQVPFTNVPTGFYSDMVQNLESIERFTVKVSSLILSFSYSILSIVIQSFVFPSRDISHIYSSSLSLSVSVSLCSFKFFLSPFHKIVSFHCPAPYFYVTQLGGLCISVESASSFFFKTTQHSKVQIDHSSIFPITYQCIS